MEHTLPPLPFAIDALAPHYSKETLEFHHGKHHNAYVSCLILKWNLIELNLYYLILRFVINYYSRIVNL